MPVVPSFSDTLNTLAKAALAKSSPIMTSTNPWDKASVPQAMIPYCLLFSASFKETLSLLFLTALPAVLQSNTLTFLGTLLISTPHSATLL
ncbi:hypothetical protein L3X38_011419 [Prunus dulcis]|uniref:Uncharacterized protein n=1 Tax=Prunus dulcis TaxID=3755 RepID=A0AAD4WI67_PRUDU|nr:hypothetical protein L3X38_011419 [Prunus dulcis]